MQELFLRVEGPRTWFAWQEPNRPSTFTTTNTLPPCVLSYLPMPPRPQLQPNVGGVSFSLSQAKQGKQGKACLPPRMIGINPWGPAGEIHQPPFPFPLPMRE